MQTMLEQERNPLPVNRWALKRILVPSDLSDASRAAVAQSAVLAARFGSEVTAYHAVEFPDHESPHWAFSDQAGVLAEHERSAREQLQECTSALTVPVATVVERAASPVTALLERIVSEAPDLTVMASHHREGLSHLLLGSVAEQVVAHSTSPVLCLRGDTPLDRALSGCTVLATDFSAESAPALDAAGTLSGAFGGHLLVVYSPSRRPDLPWSPYSFAERWLTRLSHGLTVRVLVDTAPLPQAVSRVLRPEEAGLLVIPRRHRPAFGKAASMVRHGPSSVLVV